MGFGQRLDDFLFSHTKEARSSRVRAPTAPAWWCRPSTTPTYAPIWDPENPQQFYNNFYGANLTSPRENMARTDYNQDVTDRLLLSGGLTFYLAKDLTFKSTVSMDRRWVHSSSFLDPIPPPPGLGCSTEPPRTPVPDDMRMIYDNILTWNKSISTATASDDGRHVGHDLDVGPVERLALPISPRPTTTPFPT